MSIIYRYIFSKPDPLVLDDINNYYNESRINQEPLSQDTILDIYEVYDTRKKNYNSWFNFSRNNGSDPDSLLRDIIADRKGARSLLLPKSRIELINKIGKTSPDWCAYFSSDNDRIR